MPEFEGTENTDTELETFGAYLARSVGAVGLNERDPIEEQTNVEVTEETHDHGDQTLDHGDQTLDGDVEELQGHGGDSGQPDEVLNFHCGKF